MPSSTTAIRRSTTETPPRMPGAGRWRSCTRPSAEARKDQDMWIGWIEFDLLLGDVHSLKEKRSVVRPLIAEVRKRFDVSIAEVEHQDLYRRAAVGVGLVAADRAHIVEVLDAVE